MLKQQNHIFEVSFLRLASQKTVACLGLQSKDRGFISLTPKTNLTT